MDARTPVTLQRIEELSELEKTRQLDRLDADITQVARRLGVSRAIVLKLMVNPAPSSAAVEFFL